MKFTTAEARWSGVGPYYAMFPAEFATSVINRHTEVGDTIIDPFSGRGTSVYCAATNGRHGIGIEINPVGWIYAAVKLHPAERWRVEERLHELASSANRYGRGARALPPFFSHCFSAEVLAFLLAARSNLHWRRSVVDRTLMALLLVDLHGKRELAFSNQMRQTKCMSPDYAIRWWKARRLRPPGRDPVEFVLRKMKWRYGRGLPQITESRVYLGDCTHGNPGLRRTVQDLAPKGARLLFTSPPYLGVTNYHYDQWLRYWLLGGPALPRSLGIRRRGRFEGALHYRSMLLTAFERAREFLARDATVYVRTDRREQTLRITREVLRSVFPKHRMSCQARPLRGFTQTRLFGNAAPPQGEVDIVLEQR